MWRRACGRHPLTCPHRSPLLPHPNNPYCQRCVIVPSNHSTVYHSSSNIVASLSYLPCPLRHCTLIPDADMSPITRIVNTPLSLVAGAPMISSSNMTPLPYPPTTPLSLVAGAPTTIVAAPSLSSYRLTLANRLSLLLSLPYRPTSTSTP